MPLINCTNLVLGYNGNAVVSELSFTVNDGDYLCVVGANGSGKSTLMKTLLKLIKPMSGQITEDGTRAGGIGYLPQQTAAQKDFPASVTEVVRSGCLNRGGLRPFYSKSEKQTASVNMERLGVSHLAKKCFRELSGGQQQRVLLARALCAAGRILLLDEPAAGLDPAGSSEMYDCVTELNNTGMTIIMISHDIAASVRYASHILHIGNSSALFFGTKDEYVSSEIGQAFQRTGGESA